MGRVCLEVIGTAEPGMIACVAEFLTKEHGCEVAVRDRVEYPRAAFEPRRNQYYSKGIIAALCAAVPDDGSKVVAVTDVDLCTPVLSFVFGEAQLKGRIAVVSVCRLRQEYYHLPPDENLLAQRLIKEVVHELGHTYGLYHCDDAGCVMHFCDNILGVDSKGAGFCPRCARFLADLRKGET